MVKLINQGKKYFIQNKDKNSIEAVIDRLNKARATLQKAVKAVNDTNKKLEKTPTSAQKKAAIPKKTPQK